MKIRNTFDMSRFCDDVFSSTDIEGFAKVRPESQINIKNYLEMNPEDTPAILAETAMDTKFAHMRMNIIGRVALFAGALAAVTLWNSTKDAKRIKRLENELQKLNAAKEESDPEDKQDSDYAEV